MSDHSDDMEAYAGQYEEFLECGGEVGAALRFIRDCKLSEFNDEKHMINAMKKAARTVLKIIKENGQSK